jgi:lipopolysaccharide/colanic/teichoic acid biosynthesis glycosyltransferase
MEQNVKRVFDLVLASIGLIAVSPLLVVLAIWIKLDSKGPVFYRGQRAGRRGRPFCIFKLRTMRVGAEELEHNAMPNDGRAGTRSNDPRITCAGRPLRRYKLDELPQLINVVRGDMSLVGPRPEVLDEVQHYSDEERELLTVRPGITDWASIRFCQEGDILGDSEEPSCTYYRDIRPEKIRLGLLYVRHNSLLTDVRIIIYTLRRVIGAYRSPTQFQNRSSSL